MRSFSLGAQARPGRPERRIAERRNAERAAAPGRALVPLRRQPADGPSLRPQAAFLAHLIAIRADAPQSRRNRRGEPRDAVAAYAATQRRSSEARSPRT